MSVKTKRNTIGGRVRIAEVLAEARASLKEPSRPITPAGLDARIDFIPESDHLSKSTYKANTSSYLYTNAIIRTRSNDSSIRSKLPNSNSRSDVSLLLLDIQDTINVLDTELQNPQSDLVTLNQTLYNMTQSIDKFAKLVKSNGLNDYQELYNRLINSLVRVLDSSHKKSIRQQTCRHILRLHLVQYPMNIKEKLSPDDARILLRTTRDMYLSANEPDDDIHSNNGSGSHKDSNDYEKYDHDRDKDRDSDGEGDDIVTGSSTNLSSSSSSSSSSFSYADDVMTRGGIDFILEFLGIIWEQFKSNGGLNIFTVNGVACKMFLEAGVNAAGILNSYSTKKLNRKRLSHIGAMNIMSDGIKSVIQAYSAYKHKLSIDEQNNYTPSTDVNVTISQMGYMMVQIVATIRNFSLDSSGRQVLLSNHTICHISNLLHLFSFSPELCLNCVRVTAKLTLSDPFRTQLNSKQKYITAIAKVINQEGELCKRVMNHDTTVVWPTWTTWSLLSRAAFTLGNLTTRNDANRILIANTCGCLKPLIMILQTCSYSLMTLFSGRNLDSDGDNEDDSEDNVDDNDDEYNDDDEYGNDEDYKNKYDEDNYNSKKKLNKKKSFNSLTRKGSREEIKGGDGSDNEGQNDDDGTAEYELSDATVKLLRLYANLSINESIGYALAKRKDSTKMLLELLTCSEIGGNHEELQLNVVAACTNLTFYTCRGTIIPDDSAPMSPRVIQPSLTDDLTIDLQSLSTRLSNYLFHENNEVVLEAARALGNLTRCDAVIHSLCSTRAVEALVLLLNHTDTSILLAVTGALVNVSANVISTPALTDSEKPIVNLGSVLRRSSFKNLQLSTLVCQVLHNLLLHGINSNENLKNLINDTIYNTLQELIDCATEFLDDLQNDNEFEDEDNENTNDNKNLYMQFITVGNLVINYIENNN